jgi:FkbH-like protein
VLDLDNTLWGGVIGDDGLEGIRLGDLEDGEAFVAFQRYLLSLKERGIILAVCSKNDHDNAVLPFARHPDMVLRQDDIAVFVANWSDKAENIRAIREVLNIGFDSMVFVDDNPFERNLVRGLLPEVIVPEMPEDPALYVRALARLNLFETTTYSHADLDRSEQYRVEARRHLAKASFASVDDYLRSLEMKISVERFSRPNLARIAQLIQRSNQFNLTTRRYGEGECASLMADQKRYHAFTLSLGDRFGSYGLIAVAILELRTEEIEIDSFLMSCRVLQRGVEDFAMNHLVGVARTHGAARVLGRYIPTAKNGMVRDFFGRFGFVHLGSDQDGQALWSLDVSRYVERPVLMSVIFPAEVTPGEQ